MCVCRFACNMKRCALRRPEERVTGEMLSVNKAGGVKKAVTPVFVLRINVIFGKGPMWDI